MGDLCRNCIELPMHQVWVGGIKNTYCCSCFVEMGYAPADWHLGCMKAYNERKVSDNG